MFIFFVFVFFNLVEIGLLLLLFLLLLFASLSFCHYAANVFLKFYICYNFLVYSCFFSLFYLSLSFLVYHFKGRLLNKNFLTNLYCVWLLVNLFYSCISYNSIKCHWLELYEIYQTHCSATVALAVLYIFAARIYFSIKTSSLFFYTKQIHIKINIILKSSFFLILLKFS